MTVVESRLPDHDPAASRFTTTIRPGINFPDWSVVTSGHAARALADVLEAFGAEALWRDFSAEEDIVRRAILHEYLEMGSAPTIEALAARTELPETTIRPILGLLRQRDLVVMDDAGNVTGAYPLTDRETEHKVHINGRVIHAMCAIDALGVGRMYGCDVTIESRCRATGAPVRVTTAEAGKMIKSVEPATAVVWSGAQLKNGLPAADTLCTVIAFFASDNDLESWRAREHPDIEGYRLSIEEATQAGQAIFGPMLATAEKA